MFTNASVSLEQEEPIVVQIHYISWTSTWICSSHLWPFHQKPFSSFLINIQLMVFTVPLKQEADGCWAHRNFTQSILLSSCEGSQGYFPKLVLLALTLIVPSWPGDVIWSLNISHIRTDMNVVKQLHLVEDKIILCLKIRTLRSHDILNLFNPSNHHNHLLTETLQGPPHMSL